MREFFLNICINAENQQSRSYRRRSSKREKKGEWQIAVAQQQVQLVAKLGIEIIVI